MTLMQFHIYSDVLQMNMDTWALLPDRPQNCTKPLKVLWLLHGGSGDQTGWVRSTRVEEYAAKYPDFAVILPNAYHSCFINVAKGQRFNDYIGSELVQIMRGLLPQLSTKREDNWISGFSNGGYGALMVGLNYPETFGVIGAYGAGDKADADFSYRYLDKLRMFGEGDMKETEYCTRKLIRELPASGRPIPVVDHGCGEFDNWVGMNLQVKEEFEAVPGDPYQYKFTLVPGEKHSSKAMDILIEQFLRRMFGE